VDLALASLKFGMKNGEGGDLLETSNQLWVKTGADASARYTLHVQFASDDLNELFFDEKDPVAKLSVICEIEWVENVASPLEGWPTTLRGTTQDFPLTIVEDSVPDE